MLGTLASLCQTSTQLRLENLTLRHQLAVLRRSAPRSPWQRAYVKRVIGSIRRECLEHVPVFGEKSLRRTPTSYFTYYHQWRAHLSLGKDAPQPRRRQQLIEGRWSRFRKWAACTSTTNGKLFDGLLLVPSPERHGIFVRKDNLNLRQLPGSTPPPIKSLRDLDAMQAASTRPFRISCRHSWPAILHRAYSTCQCQCRRFCPAGRTSGPYGLVLRTQIGYNSD